MKVGIIFIGTFKYLDFLPNYYEAAEHFLFPEIEKQYYVFTDGDIGGDIPDNMTVIPTEHLPFPYITLYRFDIIRKHLDAIESDCDYVLFMDADTRVVDKVEFGEVFVKGKPLTGVHHPCHALKMEPHTKFPGELETNPASLACSKPGDDFTYYWQGCLWGGKMKQVKTLVETLDHNTKVDESNGIIAVWHDESHLNRYFCDRADKVHTLSPSYAYPEVFQAFMSDYPPKIVHLAKENSVYQV